MNKQERLIEVDHLRGLAMFAMILIHTTVYFLSDSPLIYNLWNYSQFAVPLFIFCSAYLFFNKLQFYSKKTFFAYFKKRFVRLVKPYYIFMIFFFGAILIRQPNILTPKYFFQSVFLIGGIDINWLVLLFLYFALLIPFIGYTYVKNKIIFWLFSTISLLSSILFVFVQLPINYKYIMWLPWSVVLLFTFFLVKYKMKNIFYFASIIISLCLFSFFYYIEFTRHHSLSFFDNKYPPTIYFLSFGIASISLLYFLAQKGIFDFFPINNLFNFLSKYSYSLYFIHYIFLYLISGTFILIHFNWITFFLSVISISIITQLLINKIFNKPKIIVQS
ncbi:MAG TPA: acyltransferase [Patescibacteria group bacterium]